MVEIISTTRRNVLLNACFEQVNTIYFESKKKYFAIQFSVFTSARKESCT